jgi:hypothetical protein
MSRPHLIRAIAVASIAGLGLTLSGTAASAASRDTTPPTTPRIGYSEGFYCHTLIIEADSTDNVTSTSALRYQVFDEGVSIGFLNPDNGEGAWGVLVLTHTGPNSVWVRAIDQAGNRSAPSRANTVTGYYTPGCTPYHF